MMVLRDWCTSPSATANLPFWSPQANRKAECRESRTLRLEGGKDCKVLPILTLPVARNPQKIFAYSANNARAGRPHFWDDRRRD